LVTPSIPPRVDYELTDLGRDLLVQLRALAAWAIENRQSVSEARARFSRRNDEPEQSSEPQRCDAVDEQA
jgi:DNA-binding HxlR family transcriptional regulator